MPLRVHTAHCTLQSALHTGEKTSIFISVSNLSIGHLTVLVEKSYRRDNRMSKSFFTSGDLCTQTIYSTEKSEAILFKNFIDIYVFAKTEISGYSYIKSTQYSGTNSTVHFNLCLTSTSFFSVSSCTPVYIARFSFRRSVLS